MDKRLKFKKPVPLDQYQWIKRKDKYKNQQIPISIPDSLINSWTQEQKHEWWACHACMDKGIPKKPVTRGGCLYPSKETLEYHKKNKCRYWKSFSWGKHYDLDRD